jgi:AraC-like DNA-binding protein
MAQRFSTATVEERSQLSYWRDVVCTTFVRYGLDASQRRTGGFRGEVCAQQLDGVQVATVVAEPHTVSRSPDLVRRSSEDDYLVNLAVRGRMIVSQDGRDAVLRPGDLTLYDSARSCRIACPDAFELVSLKVPRIVLDAHGRLPREATATPIRGDHGVGALIGPLLQSFGARVAELSPVEIPRVVSTMLELLVAALVERVDTGARHGVAREAQLFRAQRYIKEHLANPGLTPAVVAGALGMSVRYLHALFRAEGTAPFRWIQERRLEAAARLLADPLHSGRSVTDIAFAVGFKDASHFARTFKGRYAVSPRDYRNARLCR